MTTLQNDIYLRALRHEKIHRTPVWVMRQAGRYLPEYRATRKKAGDFLTLCKTPELACEVTLQPIDRFNLDAAIIFSDILTIPDAMGLELTLEEGVGPVFNKPLRSIDDIRQLPIIDVESKLSYVYDAIRTTKSALQNRVPLIGFTGSPWTLAAYMIEGQGSKTFHLSKTMLYEHPEILHILLQKLTDTIIDYLKAQIHAGAQSIMVFDTWGGLLSTPSYLRFSLDYMQKIVQAIKSDPSTRRTPIVLFTKGSGLWLESIADTGCDGVALDWTIDLQNAKQRIGHKVVLQGNMDPNIMNCNNACIHHQVDQVLADYGRHSDQDKGHIFNLGHGIQPQAKPENMQQLVDTVRQVSPQYHL